MTDFEGKPPVIIIAGGGTGGHLYPGIALAQEFQKRMHAEIIFIGTTYGIENRILPSLPYRFEKIAIRGLQRKISAANLLFPFRLVWSLWQCLKLVRKYRPAVIVGTGGYVSGPALMAGLLLHIPTVIQEQNSYPGLVNRMLGNKVNQVHVTFRESMKYFSKKEHIFVSGNPVRGELAGMKKGDARRKFGLHADRFTLFVFGGSQGAQAINRFLLNHLSELLSIDEVQILWATGPGDFAAMQRQVRGTQRVHLCDYIEDMPSAYAAADLVICRSGASTLSEIAICGLPAVLIPYPFSAANHQEFNARTVAAAGAAELLLEKELNQPEAIVRIKKLIADKERLQQMSAAQKQLARPGAAKDIVTRVSELILSKKAA